MATEFTFDYLVLVAVSTAGVVQIAAARNGLEGILLLRRWPRATEVAAASAIVGVFIWFFFGSGERNLPDSVAGLDGVTQGRLFATSAGLTIAAIFALTSVVNERWARDATHDGGKGLEALRTTTFARALLSGLRFWDKSG